MRMFSRKWEKVRFSPKKRVRATVELEMMLVTQIARPPRRMMPVPRSGILGRDLTVKRRWGFQRVKKMMKARMDNRWLMRCR